MRDAEHFIVDTRGYARSTTAEASLLRLADIGFRQFDIALAPGHLWPGDMDAAGCLHFRRFVAGQRLRVASLSLPPWDRSVASRATFGIAQRACDLAGALGVESVVVTPNAGTTPQHAIDGRGRHVDALDRLSETAASAGTALWVAHNFSRQSELSGTLVDARVGVVLEVGATDDLNAAAIRKLGRRLKSVRIRFPWRGSDDRLADLAVLLDDLGLAGLPAIAPMIDITEGTSDAALQDGVARLVAAGLGRPMSTSDVDDA